MCVKSYNELVSDGSMEFLGIPPQNGPDESNDELQFLNNPIPGLKENERLCPFNSAKCDVVLLDTELEEHQFYCEYATFKYCSMMGLKCNEELKRINLSKHFQFCAHGPQFSQYIHGRKLIIRDSNFKNLKKGPDGKLQGFCLITTCDHSFIFKFSQDKENKILSWVITLVGTKEMAQNFVPEIKLIPFATPREEEYSLLVKRWIGCVSYTERSCESPLDSKDDLSVRYDQCPSLVSVKEVTGKLEWAIELNIYRTSERKPLPRKYHDVLMEIPEFLEIRLRRVRIELIAIITACTVVIAILLSFLDPIYTTAVKI